MTTFFNSLDPWRTMCSLHSPSRQWQVHPGSSRFVQFHLFPVTLYREGISVLLLKLVRIFVQNFVYCRGARAVFDRALRNCVDKYFGRYPSSVLEVRIFCVVEGNLQRDLSTAE